MNWAAPKTLWKDFKLYSEWYHKLQSRVRENKTAWGTDVSVIENP